MIRRITHEEIVLIAEQIFLKEKAIEDFQYLSSDEIAHVKAIAVRGVQGFARLESCAGVPDYTHSGRPARKELAASFESLSPEDLLELKRQEAKRRNLTLYGLVKKIAFRVFPMEKMKLEKHVLCCRWVEMLLGAMPPPELALLFYPYKEAMLLYFKQWVPPELLIEIEFYWTRIEETDLQHHFAFIAAQYSVLTAGFLLEAEEASGGVQEYAKGYMSRLQEEFLAYCHQLTPRLGIADKVSSFNPQLWTKLAGLTPRKTIAALYFALEESIFSKLTAALPSTQKDEVQYQIKLKKSFMAQNLLTFLDVIEETWRWLYYMEKLLKEERLWGEEERRALAEK